MARQKGLIKLEGTLDDITFYEGKGKAGKTEALAKTKSGVSAERIANDPAFARTRENNSEFGRSATMAKAIRLAFNRFSKGTQAELVRRLRALLELDAVSGRGLRNFEELTEAQFNTLAGFQFNPQSKYSEAVLGSRIDFAPTSPANSPSVTYLEGVMNPPQGATHFATVLVVSVLDLATGDVLQVASPSPPVPPALIPPNFRFPTQSATASITVPVAGQLVLISAGVVFYQMVNGSLYDLNNDAKRPFELIRVIKP